MLTPEQIELRKRGVFASDIAHVARLIPQTWKGYKTWGQLYDEKLGLTPPWAGNASTEWGSLVEPIIAEAWSKKTGRKVRHNALSVFHPEIPIIGATVDYFTDDADALIVECKNVGAFPAKSWNGKPPDHVVAQVQVQLAVHGKKLAYVAAHLDGRDEVISSFPIEFNPNMFSNLVFHARQFWSFIERKQRPPEE